MGAEVSDKVGSACRCWNIVCEEVGCARRCWNIVCDEVGSAAADAATAGAVWVSGATGGVTEVAVLVED